MTTAYIQPYRLSWPLDGQQVVSIDSMFEDLYQLLSRDTISGTPGDVFYADSDGDITGLALGTTGKLLRAGASAPEWSAIIWPNSAAQGDLLYANAANALTTLAKNASASRYLSNTGASNNPAWAQVSLADGVSGDLLFANLTQATAASKLLGRGSAAGAGDFEEITLGANLTMTGTTLSASGGGTWSVLTDGDLTDPELVFASGDVIMIYTP